jgi:hypothetical protein
MIVGAVGPGPPGEPGLGAFCYAFPDKLLEYCLSGSTANVNRGVGEDHACAAVRSRIVRISNSGSGDMQNALRRAAMHNLRIHEFAKWIDR